MELFQLGSTWDRENRNGQNQFNKDVFNAFKTLPNVDTINSYIQNLESSGTLMANIGKDFPLRSVKLGSTEPGTISALAKNAIIDAKVFGAVIGKYYRVSFIANGYLSNGKERYGLTVEEINITDGTVSKLLFTYNGDDRIGNEQNANIQKISDNIETIIVDNGEIVVSVTVDRQYISNSATPEFINLSSGPGNSPTAIIDPSNYSF